MVKIKERNDYRELMKTVCVPNELFKQFKEWLIKDTVETNKVIEENNFIKKKIGVNMKKSLKAYPKKDMGYIVGNPEKDGDLYFTSEWRIIKKFTFYKKMIITYMLIGDYWIEVLETDKSSSAEIQRRLRTK